MRPKVLHLISASEFGGIQSALSSLLSSSLINDFEFQIKTIDLKHYPLTHYKADIICLHHALSWQYLPKILLLKLRNFHTPILYQEHHYCDGFIKYQVSRPKRFFLMLKLSYGIIDTVIAVSHSQAQWMNQHHLIPPKKLFVLQQGTKLNRFVTLPTKKAGETYVIGSYGRLHKQKGFDILIEAIKLIPNENIELKIAGSGELEHMLKKLASSLTNIQFVGASDNIPAFLNECDVIIIPSRWEPFGLVFQEAMAAGKPILHSGVDGLNEQSTLLDKNQSEAIFELTAESIAQAILHSIKSPLNTLTSEQRSQMRKKWDETVSQWKNLLNAFKDNN